MEFGRELNANIVYTSLISRLSPQRQVVNNTCPPIGESLVTQNSCTHIIYRYLNLVCLILCCIGKYMYLTYWGPSQIQSHPEWPHSCSWCWDGWFWAYSPYTTAQSGALPPIVPDSTSPLTSRMYTHLQWQRNILCCSCTIHSFYMERSYANQPGISSVSMLLILSSLPDTTASLKLGTTSHPSSW